MKESFSLKDHLFNEEKVDGLAQRFADAWDAFDATTFRRRVMSRMLDLELKARIDWITDCLVEALPKDLEKGGAIVKRALPEPLDPSRTDDDFGEFITAPFGHWVLKTGLDRPDKALPLLEEVTKRFTMEGPIRPFLKRYPDLVMDQMHRWAEHENYHVRRLASEGSRPRLPWWPNVDLPDGATVSLLDKLYADPTRYVTRSVANHLNDLSRTAPDLVLSTLDRWRKEGMQEEGELNWMTAHALRTLVKRGHPGALKMLGYDPDAEMHGQLEVPESATIGDALEFSVILTAPRETPALVDYVLHMIRPSGKVTAKVYKLKKTVINGPTTLSKRHPLRGNATTFTLVPGPHRLDLQVNGRVLATAAFELLG